MSTFLVDHCSGAIEKLAVIAINEYLNLGVLRKLDGHTVQQVNIPCLFKEREDLSAFNI